MANCKKPREIIPLVITVIWSIFLGAIALIVGSVVILRYSFTEVFKRVLSFIDEKSFQLAVLAMTTLVGYYQIPSIPFKFYVSIFSVLVVLKWLRGSECGILKDRVCYLIYLVKLQWMFRNFSVLGIKLHGCHPVSKIVFENDKFLIHEGTRIMNPDIGWGADGFWVPDQPNWNIWLQEGRNWPLPFDNVTIVDLLERGIRMLEPIDFLVAKGPMDGGHEHCYRVCMTYADGLLRYWVLYIETSKNSAGENVDNTRGCTDDFNIEMTEEQVEKFYFYVDLLRTEDCPLISALDDMCHCESMLDVAKLIAKDVNFYNGGFPEKRVFC